jgi:hypothetical protein
VLALGDVFHVHEDVMLIFENAFHADEDTMPVLEDVGDDEMDEGMAEAAKAMMMLLFLVSLNNCCVRGIGSSVY